MMRRRELDILYVATRVALVFLLPLYISDVSIYTCYAAKILNDHQVPYRDWNFEYPPLALPLMLIPGLALKFLGESNSAELFRLFFAFLLLPFDLLLFRAYRLAPPIRGAAFAYVMLTTALGLLLFDRFDIAVGFLIAWPFLGPKRDDRFWFWWGLGGALKLVPLLLAPARYLDWEGTPKDKIIRLVKFGAGATLPLAISVGAVAAVAHGKLPFFSQHAERGVQIESLIGSAVMFLQSVTSLIKVGVNTNFGAQHLAETGPLVGLSRLLFYGSLAGTFAALWWRRRRWDSLGASWMARADRAVRRRANSGRPATGRVARRIFLGRDSHRHPFSLLLGLRKLALFSRVDGARAKSAFDPSLGPQLGLDGTPRRGPFSIGRAGAIVAP
jgi:hypothetical protein